MGATEIVAGAFCTYPFIPDDDKTKQAVHPDTCSRCTAVICFVFFLTVFMLSVILIYFAAGSLKELFRDTMRLNTGAPSLESWISAQKKPLRTN